MRNAFNTVRQPSYAGRTTQILNCYTDNGGYYYYDTGSDHGAALNAVVEQSRSARFPFQVMQLDSWCCKGPQNGVLNWTAIPFALPEGLETLSCSTELHFVAHSREWSNLPSNAQQNGGTSEFITESASQKAILLETVF